MSSVTCGGRPATNSILLGGFSSISTASSASLRSFVGCSSAPEKRGKKIGKKDSKDKKEETITTREDN